jgi:hypothetical protein
MGDVLGYDRGRVAALLARARAVSDHLAALRSADAAAAGAVSTVDAVRGRLDGRWMPSLRAVLGSDALLWWHGATVAMPPGNWYDDLRGLQGRALGEALAERAGHVGYGELTRLARALDAARGDPAALTAFFTALGPEDLIGLVSRLVTAAPTTKADELAPVLRSALVVVAPALPPTFGAQIVHAAADARRRRPTNGAAGAALGYLFAGGQLPTSMLVSSVGAVRDVEVDHARDIGLGPTSTGAILWDQARLSNLYGPLIDELLGAADEAGDAGTLAFDPAYAIFRQLGHDGEAGRRLFTDEPTATYFFARRPITADGGRAVSAAAAAAAATDGIDPTAPAATLHDAMFVASAFVNMAGTAHVHEMLDDPHAETSDAVAAILGRHMLSVQLSGSSGRTGVVSSEHEALGPDGPRTRAQFEPRALDAMLDVAADRPEGVVSLRAALTAFQTDVATVAAKRIADGEIPPERVSGFLREAMTDAARLEGMFASHVGHRAEHHGRDQDHELSFWVHGLGAAVRLGTSPFGGKLTTGAVGQAVGPLEDTLLARFARHEDGAAADAEVLTQDATDRLLYLWDRALFNAHVIAPELPPRLLVNGELPAFDELPARLTDVNAHDPDADHSTYDLPSLLNAMDVAVGLHGAAIDDGATTDAIKAGQLPIYNELE